MKRHFIVSTDCRTIETQKEKSQESTKGQILRGARDTVSTIENHCVTATPFCPAVKGNKRSISIERVSITLRFFVLFCFFNKKNKKKRRKNRETKIVLRFPSEHRMSQGWKLLSFTLLLLLSRDVLGDRWLARPTHVTQTAMLDSYCQCSDR